MASRAACLIFILAGSSALASCSLIGESDDNGSESTTTVVVATHESWVMPEKVLGAFTDQTGYELDIRPGGDAGELTNKLVLTQGSSPIADVAFGVDNTFASRAVDEGVFAEYVADLPPSAEALTLAGEGGERLTPVDFGHVCVNVDDTWFAEEGLAPPETFDDLVDPAYEDLFVTPGAATSSPGMAFLLATIAEYGEDGWQEYWSDLMANGTRITSGWSDAYQVDFTAGGGGGDRPIVVSYDSSPPFTIPPGSAEPTTSALLETCFRQVEYAGVLDGAANEEGARAFVDFLLTEEVQAALPDNMYVFPVDAEVELPPAWERWAEQPSRPLEVAPEDVAANRDTWLRAWEDIVTR